MTHGPLRAYKCSDDKGRGTVFVTVAVVLDENENFSGARAKFRFLVDPVIERPSAQPHLRAFYRSEDREIQLEDIRSGCVVGGQGLAKATIADIITLSPAATHFYIANVTHRETLRLIEAVLQQTEPGALDHAEAPGPLIKALLAAGCNNIQAVREGRSAYVGLRARIQE